MKKVLKKKEFYIELFLIITTVMLVYSIFNLGILGLKYVLPAVLLIFIIDLFLIIKANKKYVFKNKKKLPKKKLIDAKIEFEKKVKKKKKIYLFLTIIVSIIYLGGFFVLLNIHKSMNNLFKNESTINYSVLVNKDSGYKEIDDLNEKIIGFYEEDKYNELAEKKLNKKVDVEYIGYSSIDELKYALRNEDIDGMMIMDSYLDLHNNSDEEEIDVEDSDTEEVQVEENAKDNDILEKIEDFDTKTKTIYKFKINIDNSKNTKSIDLDKGSFVIYVSGEDSYSDEVNETSRSDVNMLMVVNIKTRNVLLLSIPRDYYIKIDSKGAYDKLTHISLYGSEEAANSLGALLDVDVDYFVKFNFTTFMKATEYLLPVDVYSDYDFTTSVYDRTIGDCYTFSKGYNHITNGKMALQFVRARKNFAQGDRQRGINQTRFLRAVINKATTPSVLLKYNKILESLEGTFLTNIDNESIINIIKYVLNHNGKFNIYSMALDGSDAHRSTYSGGSTALYVMIPNQKTIESAKVAIKAVLDGDDPDIEKDASELASVKDSHEVKKAPTNYGYSSVPKVIKPEPEKEEPKKEEPEPTDYEEETCTGDDCPPPGGSDDTCTGDDCPPSGGTDPEPDPNPNPDPSVDPPNPPEEGTGSTFPKDEDEIIINNSNE